MSEFNGHEPPEGLSDSQLIRLVYRVVRKLEQFIEGPSTDRSRGVVVRLDRLERTVKIIAWLAGVAITSAAGAIASRFFG